MYELNRMRLFGVGPRGARYTDVTLDLSAVGTPVTGQNSLFAPPTRRPSPFSLLMLENGGGKSVLLKLLFSVVLPGKRNAVGGTATAMEKFVVGEDTGHVVLEWMHVRTGDRVITGKSLQWRRNARADGSRLAEAWWSLRPHEGAELDSLPFTRDGRRLRLDGFKDELEEIDKRSAATQLNWAGYDVGEWAKHLRTLGIEPDLFAIQRLMNADEGDAASAFKFRSSKDFVDWLLRVVLDPEDAVSVATNFDSYATNVGDRQALVLEHAFVAGAVDALTPVAAAQAALTAAKAALTMTEGQAQHLLAAVGARADADTAETERLTAEYAAAAADEAARTTDRERARDVVNEIRRQTLVLQEDATDAARRAALAARGDADAELRAWSAVDVVEQRNAAQQLVTELTGRLTAAEQAARPALAVRDEAAGRLLAKLQAEAALARAQRDERNATADEENARAQQLAGEQLGAARTVEQTRGRLRHAQETVAAVRDRVAAAVASGLLPAGDDPRDAAETAERLAALAAEAVTDAENAAAEAAGRATELAEAAQAAAELRGQAQGDQREATAAVQRVTDRAARLAADEHVLVTLGTDAPDVTALDANAEAVIEQLKADIHDGETALAALTAEQREDQRILDALGDGGLLPPRAEVDTAAAVLHAAGIPAHAGWRYLAESVAAAERAALIAAHPQLADGVVVVDTAQLPAAHEVLTAARLLPSAAIAVGTGAGLLDLTAYDPAQFVLEPNPALFDADAAEAERVQLRPLMEQRGEQIGLRDAALGRLRLVVTQVQAWRAECPAGHLAELTAALAAGDELLTARAAAAQAARDAAQVAAGQRDRLAGELRQAQTDERSASDRAGELRRLATAVEQSEELRAGLAELAAAVEDGEAAVQRLGEERTAALQNAERAVRAAENAADLAQRHLVAADDVVSSTGEAAQTVPHEPLAVLRHTYAAAHTAYQAVEVGQDLRLQVDAAEQSAARLRTRVAELEPAVAARAEQLLAQGDGADRAGRAAAIARVTRERDDHEKAAAAAGESLGALRNELAAATPGDRDRNVWTTLPEERRPRSVEHGAELRQAALAEQRAAQEQLEAAVRRVARLAQQRQEAQENARAFGDLRGRLQDALEDVPGPATPAAAYPGTPEAARAEVERLRAELRAGRREAGQAREAVTRLLDDVVRFASEPRFEALNNVARRSLIGLDRDALAVRAAEFADSLAQRLKSLTTDLESAGKHRKIIVDRLVTLAESALKTLRTATRLSKLPPGLGDWTGKEFLRIRFAEPDPSLLAARIGEVVDDLAATTAGRQPGARGTAPKRDGFTLILRAVEAAVPKGFTVDVLKPDSVLRDERVSVEQMNEVFSGGQELTAAIVLYCTLAALRANERGQTRSRHSGVLFLDNPIGKASAEYLLDLQQGVAAALGVQLVYTTGLSDDRALAAFPLWVRMRNDADLRAGLKHIRVAEVVRRHLPDPFSDEEAADGDALPGTVTATRVFRRPA